MSAVASSFFPFKLREVRRWLNGPRVQGGFFGLWTLLVFAFLYIPIILLVVFSFNTSKLNIRWEGFTTQWYSALLSNKPIVTAFQNSLVVACVTTVLATTLGTIGAWMLYRYRFPFQRVIGLLIFVPMVMPEVLMGVSLLVLFVQLLNIPLGFGTLIIAHTTFCFPFVLVGVQARQKSGNGPHEGEFSNELRFDVHHGSES
jgi:spermidine/putrescine transport system permease protein